MKTPISYAGFMPEDRPMGPAPLSSAILAGNTLYLSGQVAIDPHTREIVGSDVGTQSRQVIKNMEALLTSAGMTLADLVKVTIFLTDLDQFSAMNAVYGELIPAPYPARSTVGITLNDERLLIEMEAVAVRSAGVGAGA